MKKLNFFAVILLSITMIACGGDQGNKEEGADEAQNKPAVIPKSGRSMQLKDIGLASPESVIGDGTHYYVSNVGKKLEPSKKDGDGFIMKLDFEGNVVEEKFIEGLDAPKGSAIINGKFYVADIDKVKIFDMATKEPAGEIDFSSKGTQFLNDIVVKSNDAIFVSATDVNRIYEVNLADNSYEAVETVPDVQKPNGLWYEDGKLYVVSLPSEPKGKLGVINFDSKENSYEILDVYEGSLDGLAMIGGNIFFTDWNRTAFLVKLPDAGGVRSYFLPEGVAGIEGPADFFWDANKGEFWIPGMVENTLTIQTLR